MKNPAENKFSRVLILAAALFLAGKPLLSGEELPSYACFLATPPPVIDGRLDDAAWKKAPAATGFTMVIIGQDLYATEQTFFQALWDRDNLYLGIKCLESNPKAIKALVREYDGPVCGDDAVEIFIGPVRDTKSYFQLAVNSLGTRYDGKGMDGSWNGSWTAASTVGNDAWSAEVKIPFAALDALPKEGVSWGFNVNREHFAGGKKEFSCWSNTRGGFHTPERFGRLVFRDKPAGDSLEKSTLEAELNGRYVSFLQESSDQLTRQFAEQRQAVADVMKKGGGDKAIVSRLNEIRAQSETLGQELKKEGFPLEKRIQANLVLGNLLAEYRKLKENLMFQSLFQ